MSITGADVTCAEDAACASVGTDKVPAAIATAATTPTTTFLIFSSLVIDDDKVFFAVGNMTVSLAGS
jgi:hypothetical protein